MKFKVFSAVITAASLLIACEARATLFGITFSAADGSAGTGQLTGTANGDGSYNVTSGQITITGSHAGVYSIASTDPYNMWTTDNKIWPGQNPMLSYWGLLLANGSDEVNLYYDNGQANPAGYYFGGSTGTTVWFPSSPGYAVSMEITVVPEPATIVAGVGTLALLLLGAGVHSKRSVLRIGK